MVCGGVGIAGNGADSECEGDERVFRIGGRTGLFGIEEGGFNPGTELRFTEIGLGGANTAVSSTTSGR